MKKSGVIGLTDIGSRICALRKKSGLTQKELAKKLNVTLQAVSKWESGISEPSAEHICSLYRQFGAPLFEQPEGKPAPPNRNRPYMASIKELYKIGRGPSSSHTIGPERACRIINDRYPDADRVRVVLFGSLAKTGKGHGTDRVIAETLRAKQADVVFDHTAEVPHPNTLRFSVYEKGMPVGEHEALSIGGGDIVFDGNLVNQSKKVYGENDFSEIKKYCKANRLSLWEYAEQKEEQLWQFLKTVWEQMVASIQNGLEDSGILPSGLNVHKKAKQLFQSEHMDESPETRENRLICAYAFAVSEQNASAQTIVTAPTCGAAGVLPAVLYYEQQKHHYPDEKIYRALATAGIIGNIIKTNASISGAECGCQAEIGSACAMAAAALGELFDLNMDKIEYAAEIALEHHLGLTCDPVCGLVQIPCIERNAVAAMRAINAVTLANLLWQTRKISFDNIVKTMKETGNDLRLPYRETAEGGLAKNYHP